MNSIHTALEIKVVEDASDAVKQGFFYREPVYEPIKVLKVVVVKNGTESGNPTVDFVCQDKDGQKYVFMMTGALLKMIPCDPK